MKALPRYRCHKLVSALKIKALAHPAELGHPEEEDGSLYVIPEEEGYEPFRVSAEYVGKHNPEPGGYFVVYDDGYQSWSPAKAFEDGYTRIWVSGAQ